MAYMNQEKKAKIVSAVKPILKKYGVKATFAVRNHSTICLNVKAGKIDLDRKSTRLNSSHSQQSRMPSSA